MSGSKYRRWCAECGAKFFSAKKASRFCSHACLHANQRTLPDKVCEQCGNTFRFKGGGDGHVGRFCSLACRYRWVTINRTVQKKPIKTQMTLFRLGAGITWEKTQCSICRTPFIRCYHQRSCPACSRAKIQQWRRDAKTKRRTIIKAAERFDRGINWRTVAQRSPDGMICRCCTITCNDPRNGWHKHNATVDHILALARGGTHTWDNVQLLCASCNSIKSDRNINIFELGSEVELHGPRLRLDSWLYDTVEAWW